MYPPLIYINSINLGEKWGGSTTLYFNGLILVYAIQQEVLFYWSLSV